ncbi:MAG: 16S rRNA (adenine(1518)-N(6)/adenine(1519)-N(6))-dimethyltransferase RsmA [Actinomycetota bacterium]
MTHSGADIRALLDRHGLAARRALGQNFVVDPNTVRKIATLAGVGPGDPVVEIGPGLGSLTLALLEHDASITAVEMDTELVPILRDVVAGRDVTIVEGDAQQVDWDAVLAAHPAWTLVANLPYNVATPLILDLLRDVPAITEMLVMVQLEVAERLAAIAPDPAIGIPSVLVAYHGRAEIVGRVPPTVFHPKPRVDSALVRIVRHEDAPISAPLSALEPLMRAAYNQRRKMIRKSLAGMRTVEQIEAAGVDPQARPETLDLAAWGRLAEI